MPRSLRKSGSSPTGRALAGGCSCRCCALACCGSGCPEDDPPEARCARLPPGGPRLPWGGPAGGAMNSVLPVAVDVVIPVYNAVDDLARCVESVLRHTPPACRIV